MSDIKDQIIRLETLKEVKLHNNLYSDMSGFTLGHKWLCDEIDRLESELASLKSQALQEQGEIRDEPVNILTDFADWYYKKTNGYSIRDVDIDEYLKPKQSDPTSDLCCGKYEDEVYFNIESLVDKGNKFELQYVDYEDGAWTVPVLLTKERYDKIKNDHSIKKITIIF